MFLNVSDILEVLVAAPLLGIVSGILIRLIRNLIN